MGVEVINSSKRIKKNHHYTFKTVYLVSLRVSLPQHTKNGNEHKDHGHRE